MHRLTSRRGRVPLLIWILGTVVGSPNWAATVQDRARSVDIAYATWKGGNARETLKALFGYQWNGKLLLLPVEPLLKSEKTYDRLQELVYPTQIPGEAKQAWKEFIEWFRKTVEDEKSGSQPNPEGVTVHLHRATTPSAPEGEKWDFPDGRLPQRVEIEAPAVIRELVENEDRKALLVGNRVFLYHREPKTAEAWLDSSRFAIVKKLIEVGAARSNPLEANWGAIRRGCPDFTAKWEQAFERPDSSLLQSIQKTLFSSLEVEKSKDRILLKNPGVFPETVEIRVKTDPQAENSKTSIKTATLPVCRETSIVWDKKDLPTPNWDDKKLTFQLGPEASKLDLASLELTQEASSYRLFFQEAPPPRRGWIFWSLVVVLGLAVSGVFWSVWQLGLVQRAWKSVRREKTEIAGRSRRQPGMATPVPQLGGLSDPFLERIHHSDDARYELLRSRFEAGALERMGLVYEEPPAAVLENVLAAINDLRADKSQENVLENLFREEIGWPTDAPGFAERQEGLFFTTENLVPLDRFARRFREPKSDRELRSLISQLPDSSKKLQWWTPIRWIAGAQSTLCRELNAVLREDNGAFARMAVEADCGLDLVRKDLLEREKRFPTLRNRVALGALWPDLFPSDPHVESCLKYWDSIRASGPTPLTVDMVKDGIGLLRKINDDHFEGLRTLREKLTGIASYPKLRPLSAEARRSISEILQSRVSVYTYQLFSEEELAWGAGSDLSDAPPRLFPSSPVHAEGDLERELRNRLERANREAEELKGQNHHLEVELRRVNESLDDFRSRLRTEERARQDAEKGRRVAESERDRWARELDFWGSRPEEVRRTVGQMEVAAERAGVQKEREKWVGHLAEFGESPAQVRREIEQRAEADKRKGAALDRLVEALKPLLLGPAEDTPNLERPDEMILQFKSLVTSLRGGLRRLYDWVTREKGSLDWDTAGVKTVELETDAALLRRDLRERLLRLAPESNNVAPLVGSFRSLGEALDRAVGKPLDMLVRDADIKMPALSDAFLKMARYFETDWEKSVTTEVELANPARLDRSSALSLTRGFLERLLDAPTVKDLTRVFRVQQVAQIALRSTDEEWSPEFGEVLDAVAAMRDWFACVGLEFAPLELLKPPPDPRLWPQSEVVHAQAFLLQSEPFRKLLRRRMETAGGDLSQTVADVDLWGYRSGPFPELESRSQIWLVGTWRF